MLIKSQSCEFLYSSKHLSLPGTPQLIVMNIYLPSESDPLTLALSPPTDETEEECRVREEAEKEANRIRNGRRKRKRPVRVILLGKRIYMGYNKPLNVQAI